MTQPRRPKVTPEERFARFLEVRSASTALAGADPAIAPLLALAGALRTAGVAAAPAPLAPDVRARMRRRLVAVATVQDEAAAADRLRRRYSDTVSRRLHKRLAAVAGSITIFTGVAGVGVAAAHSLPGDPFCDVKRATEHVQLWIAQGDAAKGARHLEFARERLAEAKALPANSSHLVSTLAAMNAETQAGRNDLVSAYRSSHSTQPLVQLVTFAQQQYAGLVALAKTAPTSLQPAEISALQVLGTVTGTVRTLSGESCLTCLVNGTTPTHNGGPPAAGRPSSPSSTGGPQPGASANPTVTPSRPPATTKTSPTPNSTSTPKNLVPTHLLPTNLSPSKLLKNLFGKHPKATSTPRPLISSLLNGLHL
jgi:hypothetical protein